MDVPNVYPSIEAEVEPGFMVSDIPDFPTRLNLANLMEYAPFLSPRYLYELLIEMDGQLGEIKEFIHYRGWNRAFSGQGHPVTLNDKDSSVYDDSNTWINTNAPLNSLLTLPDHPATSSREISETSCRCAKLRSCKSPQAHFSKKAKRKKKELSVVFVGSRQIDPNRLRGSSNSTNNNFFYPRNYG